MTLAKPNTIAKWDGKSPKAKRWQGIEFGWCSVPSRIRIQSNTINIACTDTLTNVLEIAPADPANLETVDFFKQVVRASLFLF